MEAVKHCFTIWIRPRETIRQIVAGKPLNSILLLGVLAGIESSIDALSRNVNLQQFSMTKILLTIFMHGPVYSVAWIFIFSILFRRVGIWMSGNSKILNTCLAGFGLVVTPKNYGNSTILNVCAAVAWSYIPAVFCLPVSMLNLWLVLNMPATMTVFTSPAFVFFSSILSIWSFVITIKCLAEVEGFSVWKALAGMFLVGLFLLCLYVAVAAAVLTIFK